jgi:hypothetical protein
MKEMGYPRPTCEECGQPVLDESSQFIYHKTIEFFPSLVVRTGLGGWSINAGILEMLAEDMGIDSKISLLRMVQAVASGLLDPEKEEDRDD